MKIEETILSVSLTGTEEFILARDEKHAESMRVTAFNIRRRLPPIYEDIGIQKYSEGGRFFIRLFKRGIEDAQKWIRDSETGKLIPQEEISAEDQRMIKLMKEEGKTEEEIQQIMKENNE